MADTMTTPPSLLERPGRVADLAINRGRWPWRLCVATTDHLAATRAVDRVRATLQLDAGPMLVGQIHIVASPPPLAARKIVLLRAGIAQRRIVGVSDGTLDAAVAELSADHRRWLVFAAVRVLSRQCAHNARHS